MFFTLDSFDPSESEYNAAQRTCSSANANLVAKDQENLSKSARNGDLKISMFFALILFDFLCMMHYSYVRLIVFTYLIP